MKVRDYLLLPLHLLAHPVEGFYEMKHENRGKMGMVILNIFLLWLFYSINKQYSGFVVNDIDLHALDSLIDFLAIVLLYLLWCTGNWAVTTLTEGEGKFRDIAMAASYSMTPLILALIPATIAGNLVVQNEEAFYFITIWIAIIWFLALMFVGTMSVHNYTPGKTIVTIFLTIAAMLVVIFLILLVATLLQQVFMFLYSIYTELIFRA